MEYKIKRIAGQHAVITQDKHGNDYRWGSLVYERGKGWRCDRGASSSPYYKDREKTISYMILNDKRY